MASSMTIIAAGVLALLGIALYGLLTLRNLLQIVVALQLLVKAAVLALVLAGKISGHINLGQSLAVTIIVADTIVAVVGLALAVQIKQRMGTLDVQALTSLRG